MRWGLQTARAGGAGAPPGSACGSGYEHQNPVELGLTRMQVLELGFLVVPQALQRQ